MVRRARIHWTRRLVDWKCPTLRRRKASAMKIGELPSLPRPHAGQGAGQIIEIQ